MPSRSLSHQLDQEIFQITQKIVEDEQHIPRVSEVYQKIKNSNSSLNRRPKKILENSIERVIDVLRTDQAEGDSGDETLPDEKNLVDHNTMNRNITASWNKSSLQPATKDTEIEASGINSRQTSNPDSTSRKRPANESFPRKRSRMISYLPQSGLSLCDLGGVGDIIRQLSKVLVPPMIKPNIYGACGIQPPRGILLHGPPGCGKTMIANAFAAELKVPFISISAPSVVSGTSGESEKALREYFDEAKRIAPSLVFIDEIDAIAPKRENAQREMEKRIVAQILTCMDDLALDRTDGKPVIVIAATNRPDSLDPALRRGDRFDKEIAMSIPSQSMREAILRVLTRKLSLMDDLKFTELARRTPGFVGADLKDLVSTAGSIAIDRYCQRVEDEANNIQMDLDEANLSPEVANLQRQIAILRSPDKIPIDIGITNQDFFEALQQCQPSLKREGFTTLPDTTWADVGALSDIQQKLREAIVDPILSPEKYARVGITPPSGVLLCGPPGCGKTLLAKATANEAQANFIYVRGPQLLSKYFGDSERAVREVFVRARSSTPCIIFFDEFDSLGTTRNYEVGASARVVNALLVELDGVEARTGVYVVAATNRLDMIDEALLRPGRFEETLRIGLPQREDRVMILKTLLRKIDIAFDDTIKQLAEDCNGFSGADLEALVKQAGLIAMRRNDRIRLEDFVQAQKAAFPSVGDMSVKTQRKMRPTVANEY